MTETIEAMKRLSSRIVEQSNGCKEWVGSKDAKGYGYVRFEGKTQRAHRVAWTSANGAIPDKLHVLHQCDNPSCCNPEHLFLGTNANNVADKMAKGRHGHTKRIQCPKGHPYDEANTYVRSDGSRYCRTCLKEYVTRYRAAHRKELAERSRNYRLSNLEAYKERARSRNAANRESKREYNLKYRGANLDAINDSARRYREKNREQLREKSRLIRKCHRAQVPA